MTPLQDFPLELLDTICMFVPICDLPVCSLVCKSFLDAAQPLIFTTLTFDRAYKCDCIHDVLRRRPKIRPRVRNLTIDDSHGWLQSSPTRIATLAEVLAMIPNAWELKLVDLHYYELAGPGLAQVLASVVDVSLDRVRFTRQQLLNMFNKLRKLRLLSVASVGIMPSFRDEDEEKPVAYVFPQDSRLRHLAVHGLIDDVDFPGCVDWLAQAVDTGHGRTSLSLKVDWDSPHLMRQMITLMGPNGDALPHFALWFDDDIRADRLPELQLHRLSSLETLELGFNSFPESHDISALLAPINASKLWRAMIYFTPDVCQRRGALEALVGIARSFRARGITYLRVHAEWPDTWENEEPNEVAGSPWDVREMFETADKNFEGRRWARVYDLSKRFDFEDEHAGRCSRHEEDRPCVRCEGFKVSATGRGPLMVVEEEEFRNMHGFHMRVTGYIFIL